MPLLHYFFFHGFPGIQSRELMRACATGLRQPLAEDAAQTLVSYPGLHNFDGRFGFRRACAAAEATVRRELHSERIPVFVGHSFGAFVALEVAKKWEHPALELILLAPFTREASDTQISDLVQETVLHLPQYFSAEDAPGLVAEFRHWVECADLHSTCGPAIRAQNLTVITAMNDDDVPRDSVEKFLAQFPRDYRWVEIEDDHGFSRNREALLKVLFRHISEK